MSILFISNITVFNKCYLLFLIVFEQKMNQEFEKQIKNQYILLMKCYHEFIVVCIARLAYKNN